MLSCAIPTLLLPCCRTRKQLEESAAGGIEADNARVRELMSKIQCVTESFLVAATALNLFVAGLSRLSHHCFPGLSHKNLPRAALSPLIACAAAIVEGRQQQAATSLHVCLLLTILRHEEHCLTPLCIQRCCCRPLLR